MTPERLRQIRASFPVNNQDYRLEHELLDYVQELLDDADSLKAELARKDEALRAIATKRYLPGAFGSFSESVRRAVYELNRHATIARAALSPSSSGAEKPDCCTDADPTVHSPDCPISPSEAEDKP